MVLATIDVANLSPQQKQTETMTHLIRDGFRLSKATRGEQNSLSPYKLIWESKALDETSQDRVSILTPE
ncbi:hypothetical protein AAC387_Pa02g1422 [Persea americana]